MKIIAVANQKAGREDRHGRFEAAALRSHHRKRVLLCDLDAQANASTWLAGKNGDPGPSI